MTIHIVPGWWLIPLAITIVAYGLAWREDRRQPNQGGDYSFPGVASTILYLIATIPVLFAWLIWALLT